ncbi:pentatricopeptide repeat-containing protein [Canna indica]|uniref:Pentatricopeptide repeat-containing protein n=1 Tax=Canna indica TaxID=4628 RepID=A0AAQ3KR39_9LILI|nr:pentatricopeptide repeat-containing protein [Canna indica]
MALLVSISRRTPLRRSLFCNYPLLRPRRSNPFSPLPLLLFSSPIISSSPFPHLQISFFSSLPLVSDPGTSDFETDSDEPSEPVDESDLVGFIQLLAQAKCLSSSRKEARAFLQASSAITPTRALVCKALWELRGDSELAFLAFRWMEECIVDCRWAWHLMIWVMGKQRRFDLAWYLVRKMHRHSPLTQRALVIMMERYIVADEAKKAIKVFHGMERFKVNADLTAYYALLHALCKNKYIEEAEEFLLLNQNFFPLTADSFNIVLNGWCNIVCDVVEAKRLWREMSKFCIVPNDTSYSHMICCFSKAGNLFDSLRLYDEMKKRGWIPNLTVYNSLIYVLTRESCLKDANNIFDKIIESGFQPNVETYNSMLFPLCETHKLEEARMTMDDMIVKGIHPTIQTYHAFAKAEDTEGTMKLLKRMKDAGCGPNSYTFFLILDKFFRFGDSESALKIWTEMRRYNIIPDATHYMVIVEGLIKHGWIPKALEFYNEMKSKGFSADPKLERFFVSFMSNHKDHWGRSGKDFIFPQRGRHNTMKTKSF